MTDGPGTPERIIDKLKRVVQPNGASLVVALVVGLLPFPVLALTIDEEFVASERHDYLAQRASDYGLRTTSAFLAYQLEAPDHDHVFVLGASSVRMAITTDRLGESLSASAGRRVHAINLSTGRQTITETLALVSELHPESRGVALIGLNLGAGWRESDPTLQEAQTGVRLGFRSQVLDDAGTAAGKPPSPRTGNLFVDNRGFYLPRVPLLLRNIVSGPPGLDAQAKADDPAPTPKRWKAIVRSYKKRRAQYEGAIDANMVVLDRLLAAIDERPGMDAVLFRAPINPRLVEDAKLAELSADFAKRVDAAAEAHGVPVLEINKDARLVFDDFADGVHIRHRATSGRYTDLVADAIRDRFPARPGGDDEGR